MSKKGKKKDEKMIKKEKAVRKLEVLSSKGMSKREVRKQIAEDTQNRFRLVKAPETLYYTESMLKDLGVIYGNEMPEITLYDGSSNKALEFLTLKYPDKKIAVLNFADPALPGGFWLRGWNAQEESLARTSNLVNGLETQSEFYEKGKELRKTGKNLYSGEILYSTDVSFIKNDLGNLLIKPYTVDVITCAAPNLKENNNYAVSELIRVYDERIKNIFKVANINKVDILVLGAWGCGVFRNDPKLIAESFKKYLDKGISTATNVVFAIPNDIVKQENVPNHNLSVSNYTAFKEVFNFV